MTLEYFLKRAWARLAGCCPSDTMHDAPLQLSELRRTEWSPRFETLMRNRLIMGALRYGRLNAPGKAQWDRIPNMIERLKYYRESGNTQALVDVANLALCEFVEGAGFWKGEYKLHTKEKL